MSPISVFARNPLSHKGATEVISDSVLDWPRATNFVDPYFFFADRDVTEVTYVSPSVQDVLGYDPSTIPGLSYTQFLCHGDPLNDDIPECLEADLSDGAPIHALRSVLDAAGNRRILSVYTFGVTEFEGGPVVRRHNIARDITRSVETHTQMISRLKMLNEAAKHMTRQERDVAERIMQGKMNREIASELAVSDRTVERRRAAIMRRFGVTTITALIAKLVERDLLESWTYSACDNLWQSARNSHVALACS